MQSDDRNYRSLVSLTTVFVLVLLFVCGCENKVEEMSEYPYYIETLTKRWEVARDSFATNEPNLSFPRVLIRDLEGAIDAMDRTYQGPNREQAISELRSMYQVLRTEFNSQLTMESVETKLLPGHEADEVKASIEKAYARYHQDFLPLVEQ
jgi:hypothetical protein